MEIKYRNYEYHLYPRRFYISKKEKIFLSYEVILYWWLWERNRGKLVRYYKNGVFKYAIFQKNKIFSFLGITKKFEKYLFNKIFVQ